MDAVPSTPPPPPPSSSVSPTPSSQVQPPPAGSVAPIQSTKSKRRAVGAHIQTFFNSTPNNNWTLNNFDTHCHSLSSDGHEYVWTRDKIYSLYIDYLNKLLTEHSPLAKESRIRQLIQRAAPRRSRKVKDTQSKPTTPSSSSADIQNALDMGSSKSNSSTTQAQHNDSATRRGSDTNSDLSTANLLGPPFESRSAAPTTPPQVEDNEDNTPWTPPAPPPVPPSRVTFRNGASVDLWFRKLREQSTVGLKRPYLLISNILDFDDVPLNQSYHQELLSIITDTLPALDPCVAFALDRFPKSPDSASAAVYRSITETSPRPADVPWSPRTHPATYINQAISHLLTLVEKFESSSINISPLLREGFFDSSVNPWFIDNLFLGSHPNIFVSRKEILSFIPDCNDKFDAVFRYADGINTFDLGVIEVSCAVATSNVNHDPKSNKDYAKVHRAMSGMLDILAGLVANEWEVMKKLQVLGIMNTGWNVTVLRMIYISPKVKLLKTHRTCRISLHINKIHDIFPLLRLMTQCQVAMGETLAQIIASIKNNHHGDL